MTHVTDERKAQLDAAAEERAACLEEVKHPVAGVHVQSLIDEPESYHAGQLTPAYHVPGNVERNPLFPLTTESIQEAATEGVELIPSSPSAADLELGEGTLPKGVESIKSTGIFAEPSAATSFVAGTGDAPPEGAEIPEIIKEAALVEPVDPTLTAIDSSTLTHEEESPAGNVIAPNPETTEEQEQPLGNA
jgi:hypothetical protein